MSRAISRTALRFEVRLTAAERDTLRTIAAEAGYPNPSSYARAVLLSPSARRRADLALMPHSLANDQLCIMRALIAVGATLTALTRLAHEANAQESLDIGPFHAALSDLRRTLAYVRGEEAVP